MKRGPFIALPPGCKTITRTFFGPVCHKCGELGPVVDVNPDETARSALRRLNRRLRLHVATATMKRGKWTCFMCQWAALAQAGGPR